tara:strand:+ start:1384 stop:1593 length:210 start_codon:yes stop_codon:yes gene_type:complete
MPQIGSLELILVIIVAVLILGPKEFTIVIKKIGSTISSVKKYFSNIQSEVNNITDINEDKTKEKKTSNE